MIEFQSDNSNKKNIGCLVIFAFCLVANGVILADVEMRGLLKNRLISLDARLFDGAFRRTVKGDHLPVIPKNLPPVAPDAYKWLENGNTMAIAHGLGPKLFTGDNTLETFWRGIDMGFRIFEVDVTLTADNHLVCYHGAAGENVDLLTLDQYLVQMKQQGKTVCTFDDLVAIARSRKDVQFVLDVKSRFNDTYNRIRETIAGDPVGKAFIPQIYDFEQAPGVRKGNIFSGEIFTSYRSRLTNAQIMSFARRSGIRAVTLTIQRFSDYGGSMPTDIAIFAHPVNDPFIAANVLAKGGRGFYTSYIAPSTTSELFSACNLTKKRLQKNHDTSVN